jgi:Na+/proline symporter
MVADSLLIGGYLIVQIVLGCWAGRKIHNESDFLLGGRSLGYLLSVFSVFATWFGAEACIGSSANVFANGLGGARIEPLGYALALILCGVLLAQKLREKSYFTLADFFCERYGKRVESLSVLVLVPSTLIWTSAQILAFGQILHSVTPLSLEIAIIVAVAIVVGYSMVGGFLGSVYADLLQGLVIIAGLVMLFVLTISYHGVDVSLAHMLSSAKLSLVALPSNEDWWARIDLWTIPILGSLVSQELISRLLAAKTPLIAKRSSLIAALLYLIIGSLPVLLGLMGPLFPLQINRADEFLPELAKFILPGSLHLIFIAAILSAILATADSSILTVTGLLSHNLFKPISRTLPPARLLWFNRVVLLLCGVMILVMALSAERIFDLLILASSVGTAGVLVITLMGLWTKVGSHRGALATLVVGLVAPFVFEYLLEVPAPFLASIVTCLLVFVCVPLYLPQSHHS